MIQKLLKLFKIHFSSTSTLKDGTPIVVDGSLETGVNIFVATSDGNIPLPDGEYQLEDMTIILVKDGIVMDVIVPGDVEPVTANEEKLETQVVEEDLATQKENPIVSGDVPTTTETPEVITGTTTETIPVEEADMPMEPTVEPEEESKIMDLENKIAGLETAVKDILSKLNMITEKFSVAQPIVKIKENNIAPIDAKLQSRIDLINKLKNKQ